MRRFIHLIAIFLLLASANISLAHAHDSQTYSRLNTEQQTMWRRILLQEDVYFRPSNADYYLSGTATPDLATEFDLAEQYLRGTLAYRGLPDASPWCHFPARFAFVAKVIYGNYFLPEAFRSCNLPLPALDNTLKADIVQTFEPVDSGEALFHMDLLVHGKRFYNASVLTLHIGFGRVNDARNRLADNMGSFNKALRLVKSFGGNGAAKIITDDSPNSIWTNKHGQQAYQVNLPPEKIHLLVLLAYESKRAALPYNLLRANCHSYLEHLFLAVLPELNHDKKIFFDFMPHFMSRSNQTLGLLFEPSHYWPAPSQALNAMAKQLNWHDYKSLQDFLSDGAVPNAEALEQNKSLRLALGKAAEQREEVLKKSPELLALRDEYLSGKLLPPALAATMPQPKADENAVPVFNSTQPSTMQMSTLHVDGKTKLQLELDVFNTMSDQLQAATPYGFTMGKLALQASENGLIFDHFIFAQEKSIGTLCCGEKLYDLGVRNMSTVSVDIVNNPEQIALKAWKLKPELELNMAKGIGTITKNGWSVQVLPNLSVLTYGEYIDLNVNVNVGWVNEKWAVSASKLGRIYGPEVRRSTPDEMLRAEYKISQDARFELSYKHVDKLGTIAGVGYVFAF